MMINKSLPVVSWFPVRKITETPVGDRWAIKPLMGKIKVKLYSFDGGAVTDFRHECVKNE